MKLYAKFLSFAVAGTVWAGIANGGAKIEIEVDNKVSRSKSSMFVTFTDQGLRMEGGAGTQEPYGVIVLNEPGRMIMLQHNAKKYMEFRQDGVFAKFNQNKNKIAKQYEQAFEKMSPEKRAMMKQMLPGFKPKPKVRYDKGKADKVAGYPCTTYKKFHDNRLVEELCYTKGKDFAPVIAAMKKSEKIMKAIKPDEDAGLYLKDYGVPLRSVKYGIDGKVVEIQALKKYLPKVVFKTSPLTIPKGYIKQNLDKQANPGQ